MFNFGLTVFFMALCFVIPGVVQTQSDIEEYYNQQLDIIVNNYRRIPNPKTPYEFEFNEKLDNVLFVKHSMKTTTTQHPCLHTNPADEAESKPEPLEPVTESDNAVTTTTTTSPIVTSMPRIPATNEKLTLKQDLTPALAVYEFNHFLKENQELNMKIELNLKLIENILDTYNVNDMNKLNLDLLKSKLEDALKNQNIEGKKVALEVFENYKQMLALNAFKSNEKKKNKNLGRNYNNNKDERKRFNCKYFNWYGCDTHDNVSIDQQQHYEE